MTRCGSMWHCINMVWPRPHSHHCPSSAMLQVMIHLTLLPTWIRYDANNFIQSILNLTQCLTGAVDCAVKCASRIAPSVLCEAWSSVCGSYRYRWNMCVLLFVRWSLHWLLSWIGQMKVLLIRRHGSLSSASRKRNWQRYCQFSCSSRNLYILVGQLSEFISKDPGSSMPNNLRQVVEGIAGYFMQTQFTHYTLHVFALYTITRNYL